MDETDITAGELREALEHGERVAVFDVRRPADREWTIPGAIPLDVHDQLWANDASALKNFVPPDHAQVVFVCGRGNTSMLAAAQAREHGIPARSVFGGMKAWSAQWNLAEARVPGVHADIVQVRRTGKGCLSYVIGSQGDAAVIDPSVAPEVYLDIARKHGWTIRYVIDTHVHADHVSRARTLVQQAGAEMCLPHNQRVRYPFRALQDGETLAIGKAGLEVIATPGHTFESASFLLDCRALFTGDTLFVNGVGRPDLAAKADEETRKRARLLHQSLARLFKLPGDTVVLPGHSSSPIPFDEVPIQQTLAAIRADVKTLDLPETDFVGEVVSHLPQPPANHLKIVTANEAGVVPPEMADWEVGGNRCAVGTKADKRISG